MVINANTVVDPWAVMVKAFYTTVADSTVLGSVRSQNLTVRAHLTRMDFLE